MLGLVRALNSQTVQDAQAAGQIAPQPAAAPGPLVLAGGAVGDRKDFHTLFTIDGGDVLLLIPGQTGTVRVTPGGGFGGAFDLASGNRGGMDCLTCDLVTNFFVAETSVLRAVRWTDSLKLGEHEDFFLRLKEAHPGGVAFCPSVVVEHHQASWHEKVASHVGRPGSPPGAKGGSYAAFRDRAAGYISRVLKSHGLRAMGYVISGHLHVEHDPSIDTRKIWPEVFKKMKAHYAAVKP